MTQTSSGCTLPHPHHVTNTVLHRLCIGVLSSSYYTPAPIPDLVPPHQVSPFKPHFQPLLLPFLSCCARYPASHHLV